MHDSNDRFKTPTTSSSSKRLGGYLVEAGLITPAQVDVALNDQKIMDGMRFGEILNARGWVKQQTVEYFMKKIVEPERRAVEQAQQKRLATERELLERSANPPQSGSPSVAKPVAPAMSYDRRPVASPANPGVNDRKPLPSIRRDEDDVSWVG